MDILFRLLPGAQPVIVRYSVTALLVLAGFVLRYAIGENAGPYAFLIFILPIVASALMFDRGTGFFATAMSTALLSLLLTWDDRSGVHIAALSLFVVVSCCLVFIAEGLHRALEAAHKAHEAADLLLQEMSHRVKNKFAAVSAIIALQSREQAPETRKALEDVGRRIKVIADVHNYLQLSRRDGHIEMSAYLKGLCNSLEGALDSSHKSITLVCAAPMLFLPPNSALTIGLLVNELVTNAFKHAFGDQGGRVEVNLSKTDGTFLLSVSDNGRGCASAPREGLGTRLVKTFAEQLGGRAVWNNTAASGCVVTIEFPDQ